jgi:hypothetical protein
MMKLMMITAVVALAAANAKAQIGWTLDQCRKHWGRESSVEHPYLDESHTTTSTTYIFDSKIRKEVSFDQQGKVNDVFYIGPSEGAGFLKIAKLLEREEGVIWLIDPDQGQSYRHAYWIGYKDGIAVFHARYFFGKRDVNGDKWGESLHVLPIESPLDPPPIGKIDADWAIANAARIEAEKKAKAAAGPTKEELESAAHDAEIRASNERPLAALKKQQDD